MFLEGVDHFYIYDTSSMFQRNQSTHIGINHLMSSYISKGVVTVVEWPFDNCVEGMASGRNVGWEESKFSKLGTQFFQPPPRIAQSTALASCYTRFRYHSKYIAVIDDDEYIMTNGHTLANIVLSAFKKHPMAPALYFRPVQMTSCLSRHNETSVQFKNILPRLGSKAQFGDLGVRYEGKLVMRTDAVEMFHVHYITQLNHLARQSGKSYLTVHPSRAAIFHYKLPFTESGNIFGEVLPLSLQRRQHFDCKGVHINLDHDSLPKHLLRNFTANATDNSFAEEDRAVQWKRSNTYIKDFSLSTSMRSVLMKIFEGRK
jgi:hypothetical protein